MDSDKLSLPTDNTSRMVNPPSFGGAGGGINPPSFGGAGGGINPPSFGGVGGGKVFGYETSLCGNYNILKQLAKENRMHSTPAESILWNCLRGSKLGVRFRRQHPIGPYIVDFVCLTSKLVIEVDGGYHNEADVMDYDKDREKNLVNKGFRVIRFINEEVTNNLDNVIKRIIEEIKYEI